MPNLKLISATDTQYSAAVLKSMNDQRNHGLFCDVTIIIQDKKFRAHKTILSASSTYFHQLFSVAGQVIELNFIKAEIFEQILNYIYSAKIIRVRSDMLEELISAGQILGVKFIANLGQPLSQVKGLPGLWKETEGKSGASTKVMPIITESFSISAEEFNQTCKSADDDGDSDSDVLFVSESDSKKEAENPNSTSGAIDLEAAAATAAAAASQDASKKQEPCAAEDATDQFKSEDATLSILEKAPEAVPGSRPMLSPNNSSSIPSSPVRVSSGSTPTTPSRSLSLTPMSPSTPQPCTNSDMMGVHKKQVCTTAQQGDFKIRLSDMSSGHDAGPDFPQAAVVAKKTITLDKALEIDSISSGCKVYANIGENTYDIVPLKEDPEEGGSKAAKGKRALMFTPLKPFDKGVVSPTGAPGKKKIKNELEDHYELIMDGKTFYVCMVCKRPYVCLTSLRRHFNTHSWEKKYPCRYCNKVFALAEYRTKHEAHHTGERRYQCLMCNEMFLNYQVLSTHCKQAHNQDPSGRKEKDDTPNNLYRLLPCKSLQTQSSAWPAHEGGIPVIGEDGSVQHIMPGGEEVQSSTQSKMLNWNDIFVEPDARSRPVPVMNPPQQVHSEFDFVIPKTY
ncbi:Transcriptional regulator Kaiso [Merluccius polli]|uniref:Transcriptional regulator Kaiso n=1 Tax=Merluccius polli TaxID=89951 RepID=A0AA47M3Y9_MERPO|nr:Transcriptional regulator Kaiso [Merluccius polli]